MSHANTNTYVRHVMANTPDSTVPRLTPSCESPTGKTKNASTTPQNQNDIKDQPVPAHISFQHLQAALLGHPDQNFVVQLYNNFTFGVHIDIVQKFSSLPNWLSTKEKLK